MKKGNALISARIVQLQVAAVQYISHHRPPAILRKIGSVRRAGGGSGAERRSRNSVRARSCAVGSGAPVAVWPRARSRVAARAVRTRVRERVRRCTARGCAYFGRARTRAASGALPARWPPCSGGAWRCCGWSRSARLPPARPPARRRRSPPAPRKMRRRRPPAPARPPTTPRLRPLRRHPPTPRQPRHTPSGGGRAHALAARWSCAPRARWPGRTCAAGALPPPPPTPCSRCKCRGARAWSGWARRGGRACDTTTGTTTPRNGRSSSEYKRWWGASKRWWSRRRERGPPPRPSDWACRPAYSCPTASTDKTRICSCESLISKPS